MEENLTALIKEKTKLAPEDIVRYSTLTKSLYVDYLKRKIEILLESKDEKKARECIIKPFEKYFKTKDPKYFENLAFLADINIFLADRLKDTEGLVSGIAELTLLNFFAKKFSDDEKYWSNKLHRDIREKCKRLVEVLNIPIDEQILGKETLNILKLIELETKDHMYIDKILELKKSDDYKKNIEELIEIIEAIKNDEAASIVLSLAENELIMSLAQQNEYHEAFEKAKEISKGIKRIKNKIVKNFMLGEVQLNLFRVNIKRQDYKQAEKEAKKAIEFYEDNINTIVHACFTILELASCYMIQGRFDKAESLLERPIEISGQIGSSEFLARLYELLGGIKLKLDNYHAAAMDFGASALFYLISDDSTKYQEFLTLAVNLYNEYLKSKGFSGVKFD